MSIKKARGGVILSHVDVFQMVDDWRQHRQFIPKPWKPASITLDLAMMRLAEQVRADGYGFPSVAMLAERWGRSEGYARALMPSDTDGEE
jgi:hypothetical protein